MGCYSGCLGFRTRAPLSPPGRPLTFLSLSQFIPEAWPLTSEQRPGTGSKQGGEPGDSLVQGTPRKGDEAGKQNGVTCQKPGSGDVRRSPEKGPVPVLSWTGPQPAVGHTGPGVSCPLSEPSALWEEASPAQRAPAQLCSGVALTIPPPSLGIWQGFPMTSRETGEGGAQSPELWRHLQPLSPGEWALGTSPAEERRATGACLRAVTSPCHPGPGPSPQCTSPPASGGPPAAGSPRISAPARRPPPNVSPAFPVGMTSVTPGAPLGETG